MQKYERAFQKIVDRFFDRNMVWGQSEPYQNISQAYLHDRLKIVQTEPQVNHHLFGWIYCYVVFLEKVSFCSFSRFRQGMRSNEYEQHATRVIGKASHKKTCRYNKRREQISESFAIDHYYHNQCSSMHGCPRSERTEMEYWQMDPVEQQGSCTMILNQQYFTSLQISSQPFEKDNQKVNRLINQDKN